MAVVLVVRVLLALLFVFVIVVAGLIHFHAPISRRLTVLNWSRVLWMMSSLPAPHIPLLSPLRSHLCLLRDSVLNLGMTDVGVAVVVLLIPDPSSLVHNAALCECVRACYDVTLFRRERNWCCVIVIG